MNAADLILVFDEENVDEVRHRFSHADQKIHLLDPAGPIRDPFGTDEARFEITYRRIADCLAALEATRISGHHRVQPVVEQQA